MNTRHFLEIVHQHRDTVVFYGILVLAGIAIANGWML